MCLAIPGKVLEVRGDPGLEQVADIQFAGSKKEISLAFLPEATVGCYVLVHAGLAISIVDEEEAARTLKILKELGEDEPV